MLWCCYKNIFFQEISLFLIVRVEIGFVLLQGVPLWKEEVTLFAEEPVFRHRVRVVLIGVPVKVTRPVEGVEAKGARDSHAAEGDLGVGGGGVGLQDGHAGEVHLARGTHQPAVHDVFQVHLENEKYFIIKLLYPLQLFYECLASGSLINAVRLQWMGVCGKGYEQGNTIFDKSWQSKWRGSKNSDSSAVTIFRVLYLIGVFVKQLRLKERLRAD